VHEQGTEAHHGARDGEISIPALSTRSTTYTFERPGSLIYACHLPGHLAYGMKGVLHITPHQL
jgi:plastocyanin